MTLRPTLRAVLNVLLIGGAVAHASLVQGQADVETFTATATVTTAGGATASIPMTIVIDRKMTQDEAANLTSAFKSGGGEALRKALVGVAPTGSVRLGKAAPTATRILLERPTDKGRLLTMVTDEPMLFLGAGVPGARPKTGYDFAVVDIEVDANGNGSGTLAPAAKVDVKGDAFIVGDYASESVRLIDVKKVK